MPKIGSAPSRLAWGGAFLCLALASPALAQTMTVGDFLSKTAAMKRGTDALPANDVRAIKAEMAAILKSFRADRAAGEAAGKPLACPPKGARLGQRDVIAALEELPPEARTLSLKEGFYSVVAAKWPCG